MARLRGSYRYEEVAEEFGIPPGLAYMIVTGLPADGSDVLRPEELEGRQCSGPGAYDPSAPTAGTFWPSYAIGLAEGSS